MKLKFANIFFTICYCLQFEKRMVHTVIPISKIPFFLLLIDMRYIALEKKTFLESSKYFTKSFEQDTALLLNNFDDLKELGMDKVCQVWFKLAQRFYIVDEKVKYYRQTNRERNITKSPELSVFTNCTPSIHSGQSSLKYFATYQSIKHHKQVS